MNNNNNNNPISQYTQFSRRLHSEWRQLNDDDEVVFWGESSTVVSDARRHLFEQRLELVLRLNNPDSTSLRLTRIELRTLPPWQLVRWRLSRVRARRRKSCSAMSHTDQSKTHRHTMQTNDFIFERIQYILSDSLLTRQLAFASVPFDSVWCLQTIKISAQYFSDVTIRRGASCYTHYYIINNGRIWCNNRL